MARDSWRSIVDEIIAAQEEDGLNTRPGPAFQWYPKQILGDDVVAVMDMTAEGAHRRLIDFAWQQDPPCSIPDDPLVLRSWCKHPESWDELVWPQVRRAWRLHEGRWWQIGLCRAYLKQLGLRRTRSTSASSGWEGRKGEGRRQAVRSVDHPEQMELHGLGDAFASKMDGVIHALQSSSSSSSSIFNLQSSSPPAAAAEGENGPPAAATADRSRTVRGHDVAAEIAAGARRLENTLREATGIRRALSYADRERLLDWIAARVPIEVLEESIREIAARQATRGRSIGSFRYFVGPLTEAVQEWRESGERNEDAGALEGYRAYIVAKCEHGLLVDGGRIGDVDVPGLHPDQLRRAKERALAAGSVRELETVGTALARSAQKQTKEA